MDKLQVLVAKKKKAADTETTVEVDTTTDDAAIKVVEASINKIESDVDNLASFNTKEFLDLVI